MLLTALAVGVCLVLPNNATVIDSFRAPTCERCAGNRGLELAVSEGSDVVAGVRGTVSFAGAVGGRNYVVVRSLINTEVRVTYGGLAATSVQRGDVVTRGQRIGVAQTTMHLGVRIGEQYVDPVHMTGVDVRPRYRITLGARPQRSCLG